MPEALAEWDRTETYQFEVSPIDQAWVSQYRWFVNRGGYIYRRTTRTDGNIRHSMNVYLHREIMGLEYGDGLEVDHEDGDPANNRRDNLEIVTRLENERRKRQGLIVSAPGGA